MIAVTVTVSAALVVNQTFTQPGHFKVESRMIVRCWFSITVTTVFSTDLLPACYLQKMKICFSATDWVASLVAASVSQLVKLILRQLRP